MDARAFLEQHATLTRRYLLQLGTLGATAVASGPRYLHAAESPDELAAAIRKLEPYFTPVEDFRDVSRGKPVPHSLTEEKLREVGLTRDTWNLEVVSDPEQPARLAKTLTKAAGTAVDFAQLLKLAEANTVRFAKVMTCLNIGCPLGMGLWEGVPLRDVIALTQPRENLRRVFYYGYHNDQPEQMFRSSLPISRVLEDPFDLPPVILCYKLNGDWLDMRRGGPVRVVVPEAYGFKSVKWLTHIVLTNLPHANDTYANQNNDVDSPLKSFAATLLVPEKCAPDRPIVVTGYAQVGISGLTKVQVSLRSAADDDTAGDPHFTRAPWQDATILGPPANWGAVPDGAIPRDTLGFDEHGKPTRWPLRLTKIHWAVLLPGQPAGEYKFRCRTVDDRGLAQPLPRPLRKLGHNAIETVTIKVG